MVYEVFDRDLNLKSQYDNMKNNFTSKKGGQPNHFTSLDGYVNYQIRRLPMSHGYGCV